MKISNKDILVSQIRLSEQHWSRDITEADVAELADNIDKLGQLHQVVVRPVGSAGNRFELIAGERRLRAVKLLGKDRIRCAVIKYSDKDAFLASLSEGLHTKKPSSVEWQQAAKLYTDAWAEKYGQQEVVDETRRTTKAKKTTNRVPAALGRNKPGPKKSARTKAIEAGSKAAGVTTKTFRNAVAREENLITSAQTALKRERITIEQADILAKLSPAEQRVELPKMLEETKRQTDQRRKDEKKAEAETPTAVARELLDDLLLDCRNLATKATYFTEFADGKDIDYPTLRRADMESGTACLQALKGALDWVTSD